jgi:uncharacterized protein with predicted RNA binding PUA domain
MEMRDLPREEMNSHIAAILQFQFNENFAKTFFQTFPDFKIQFSGRTGKIKQLHLNNQLLATYKPQYGNFSFSISAIQQILPSIPPPRFRVKILTAVASFIEQGKSVFAKHVIEIDPEQRAGDEVFVVDETDRLLALGKLNLPPYQLRNFTNGTAVKVRHGIRSSSDEEINDN